MKILQSIRSHLVARPGVTIHTTTSRIYTKHLPQGATLPAVSINLIDAAHEHDLDGSAGNCMARIQVNSWAEADTGVDDLAEAVRMSMQGFVGTMGTHSIGVVILDNEVDLDEEPEDGGPTPIYRRAQDYRIRFTETRPTF